VSDRAPEPLQPRDDVDWSRLDVMVAGAGITGRSVADQLARRCRRVTVVDTGAADADRREHLLASLPADVDLVTPDDAIDRAQGVDLVVASPGWRLDAPLFVAAQKAGRAVWGELDLAWVLQAQGRRPDTVWLPLTGTNGKSTTVRMLEAMLRAGGKRAEAVGNIGHSIVDAVVAEDPPEVLALEVSSLQLSRSTVMRPRASAVLNLAPDHLDWHDGWDNYFAAKARVYERTQDAIVYNVHDPSTVRMAEHADVVDGCRAIGITNRSPALGQLGVVEDLLIDRAFTPERTTHGVELASFDDIAPFAPHNVTNALFAAALALSAGVEAEAIRGGLHAFTPEPHRIADAGSLDGVTFIDDSKATNPHAAQASLKAYDRIVWIVGGLAKGVTFDDLVAEVAPRLVGAVLIGEDRHLIAEALARHAPQVPVIDADDADTDPMTLMRAVVRSARGLARPGDTVLLAPACASMDRFTDYHDRGRSFAAAVAEAMP
jgi:UDP-N-acetylmuramoylalanine--D-glutamate ligase